MITIFFAKSDLDFYWLVENYGKPVYFSNFHGTTFSINVKFQ